MGAWRRSLRVKRGLCPACAYPVGVSPVCTECGGCVRGAVTVSGLPGRKPGRSGPARS
jgi:hypothetical protein